MAPTVPPPRPQDEGAAAPRHSPTPPGQRRSPRAIARMPPPRPSGGCGGGGGAGGSLSPLPRHRLLLDHLTGAVGARIRHRGSREAHGTSPQEVRSVCIVLFPPKERPNSTLPRDAGRKAGMRVPLGATVPGPQGKRRSHGAARASAAAAAARRRWGRRGGRGRGPRARPGRRPPSRHCAPEGGVPREGAVQHHQGKGRGRPTSHPTSGLARPLGAAGGPTRGPTRCPSGARAPRPHSPPPDGGLPPPLPPCCRVAP